MSKKIILLAGPTASGKSKLALALAKKINGEIINADSMQIYKEFSILSSKPSCDEIKKCKHHLYGFISVKDFFSAGDWLKLAKDKIKRCFLTRIRVRNLFHKIGYKSFYDRLVIIDPKVKNKILPTDSQRTQRAYEVILKTKKSLFDWIKKTKSDFLNYEIKKIYLDFPRTELLKKISLRTEMMFDKNCIEEVKKFNTLNLNKSLSANKLIGVQDINSYLKGEITLDQCKDRINIKTRQYAKRQNTWARGHMKNWKKLYSKDFSSLLKKTLKEVS